VLAAGALLPADVVSHATPLPCPESMSDVDLEFRERFEHSMFETDGGRVQEELIDDRIFVE
jgi:hypothetical protein